MFFRENNFVISPSSSNIARGKPYNDFNHMEKKLTIFSKPMVKHYTVQVLRKFLPNET